MSTEITMPKLSDTMTEGLFACWRKNIGDRIERGDIIAEVETDKAVMELEAFTSGILIQTMVHGGENVEVGAVLGLIGTADELAASAISQPPSTGTLPVPPQPESAVPVPLAPPAASPLAASHSDVGHEKASPLVRRIAREEGIDLDRIKGSGPEGRITQDDMAAFIRNRQDKPAIEATPAISPADELTERTLTTPMRRAIADTVTESWHSIPHFSVTVEIDMDACCEIVRELKEGSVSVGYNTLVIKACATALQNFPLLCSDNRTVSGDISIGFAVSKPDGLLMPVIRQCQRLSVAEIEAESSRLADKSRSGRLGCDEMSGGSFSVSNLGMYGVDQFTALILPGQRAILAIGAIAERAVARNGHPAVATTMRVTLSCDHRYVDGAYAASFLAQLRSILEKPVALLL